MTIKLYQLGLGLAALLVVVVLWFLLAPAMLGGSTSYAAIRGTSMAAHFHNGDLAVIRGASDYSVGEIAAYTNHDLNRVVLHRIVRRDGDHFVFKGDSNGYVDSARATKADIVGRLWFTVPGVGAVLAGTRTSLFALPLALLALLLTVVRWSRRRKRRLFRGLSVHDGSSDVTAVDGAVSSAGRRRAALVLSAMGGLFGVAYLVTLSLPAGPSTTARSYEQRGSFSYGATPASAASVYPTGAVTTGDPIFLRLVRDLRVTFAYRFSSTLPHSLEGTAGLRAVLRSPEGWKHEVVLQAPLSFHSGAGVTAGTFHLDRLRALIARFQAATGVTDATYTLTVKPLVAVHGTVAQAPVTEQFAPALQFQLDALELRVVPPQTLGNGPPPDPFVSTQAGSVSVSAAPATVGPFGWSVSQLRVAALLAFLLTLLAAFAKGLPALRARCAQQVDRDQPDVLFGDRLVRVAATRLAVSGAAVVDVPDAHSLLQLADGLERPILYDHDGATYLVEGDAFIYRYAALDSGAMHTVDAQPASPPVAPRRALPPLSDARA